MQACAVGNFVMTQWDISPFDKKTSRCDAGFCQMTVKNTYHDKMSLSEL